MTEAIETMTWWTAKGFVRDAPSLALATALDGCEDWVAAMQNAGYDRAYSAGTGGPEPALEVWLHEDGHLYVDVVDRTSFLVAQDCATAFWVNLLPTLEAPHLAYRQTEALELQAKAFVAWVRRGHGMETINEYGFTRDEDLRWQEDQRRRAAQVKPKA